MAALEDVATELYGMAPEDFVAARDERAKAARGSGDRQLARDIAALRRPSVAAWAVNRLVREHPEEVDRLLALAARVRAVQQALAGGDLRDLNRQRHAVLGAVGAQARALAAEAGRPLSETVGRQVDATLRAALADRTAGAAVRSGLLVRELEATGFAPVELDDAVALPEAVVVPPEEPVPETGGESAVEASPQREKGSGARTPRAADQVAAADQAVADQAAAPRSRGRERDEARRGVEEADRAAAAAVKALGSAEDAVGAISGRRSALAEEIRGLTQRLQELRAEGEALAREESRARRERDTAARAARAADYEVARARARLAGLE